MTSLLLLAAGLLGPIPLEPGTFWEYRESSTENLLGVYATEDAVLKIEVRAGTAGLVLAQTGGFEAPFLVPVERGRDWIRLGTFTGEEPLPLPLELGRRGPDSEGGPGWSVEAEEEVVVPAGAFRALRCALRTWRCVSLLWIAEGTGVVRQTEATAGSPPFLERVLLRRGP